ncbi:MAG: F0F1 ATP synthase subunit epsilon [Candidatus Acidoferrales bacterium]
MALLPESVELQVVTPERLLVREPVDEVQVPARNGYLGILPGHAPLLSELRLGELSYRKGTAWTYLSVFWGFVEVLPDRVVVLAEIAERADEINIERAQHARQRAEERLQGGDPELDWDRVRVALERSLIRIQIGAKVGVPSRQPETPARSS